MQFRVPSTAVQDKPTTIILHPKNLPSFNQVGGYINDASCLNRTPVFGIVKVHTENDLQNALGFARAHNLKVTAAGQRHSMGGQSFTHGGIVLDMRGFNAMTFDQERRVLKVQSGATWEQVQKFLDPKGFAVISMQSINIFTIGGALSVNAHGIANNPGQVAPTVKSIRIMLSDGEIKTASPSQNAELFRHAIGGYGLFGVILDADIAVVPNEMYARHNAYMNYRDFADFYE